MANYSDIYAAEFNEMVHMVLQQGMSTMWNFVRKEHTMGNRTHSFPVISKRSTMGQERAAGELVVARASDINPFVATMKRYEENQYVDELENIFTRPDLIETEARNFVSAIMRRVDNTIVQESLELTTQSVAINGGGSAGGLDLNKFLAAQEVLDATGTHNMKRFMVVGSRQWNELKRIPEANSGDFMGEMYPWLRPNMYREWDDVIFVKLDDDLLPKTGDTRTCYLFHADSVGVAYARDVSTTINWVPERTSHLVHTDVILGATLLDNTAVVKVLCDES